MKYLITLSFLCTLFFPSISEAFVEQPFGGLVTASIPCTCSYSTAIVFAPLYPNPPFPFAGTLEYIPGISILFPLFFIGVPSTWHLGQYIPGAGSCLVGVPPECVPLPTGGTITLVGTSG